MTDSEVYGNAANAEVLLAKTLPFIQVNTVDATNDGTPFAAPSLSTAVTNAEVGVSYP